MYIWPSKVLLPVATTRYIVAEIKTLAVLSEFCIDSREITSKYKTFYANFNGTILKGKKFVKEKL